MKPIYQTNGITLYCADCVEVLPLLGPLESVITDPPWPGYEHLFAIESAQKTFNAMIEALPETTRIAVQLACNIDPAFCASVSSKLPFFRSAGLEYARPGYCGRLLHTGDIGYLYGEPPPVRPGRKLIPGRCISNHNEGRETKEHPCPRKLQHVEWLVKWWTDKQVIDPFMGSGTTAIAALKQGKEFIGIERNPDWCALAIRRIQAAYEQTDLINHALNSSV